MRVLSATAILVGALAAVGVADNALPGHAESVAQAAVQPGLQRIPRVGIQSRKGDGGEAGIKKPSLWTVFDEGLGAAKYIDLSHTIEPGMPVWRGFGNSTFLPATNKLTGKAFTYAEDLFEATAYRLTTDQLGTQLDAPAHFNPHAAASDEIPATYALRKLVVIDISDKVAANASYGLTVADILEWEAKHGRIPQRAVVFVRSDWSRTWPFVDTDVFPQVLLQAVQFLHLQRGILFHGHEPLDADMTPEFDSERWILTHGFAQAEGVANLHLVPPTGCLLSTGFPKFRGGTGNYVRFVAVCEPSWPHGVQPGAVPEAPMPEYAQPLVWDNQRGYRARD
ncbi:hypothetical protein LPJ61_000825 [Coemansia biformis]|uniref:Cyclase n=1 Tax=Coemansia biformis TaxID=1286918 RepID=A0A9W8D189_9FUNG|nr:hypothetical protein LPJ61_000825 [Coemansia biformis]